MNLDDLKETISKGLSKKEVKKLFGKPSGVLKENSLDDVPDNPEYWRYDLPNNGYSYNPESPDNIDLEGLQNGNMRMQLRLSWTSGFFNQKVSSYSIFYKDEGSIYWYDDNGGYSVYDINEQKFIDLKE